MKPFAFNFWNISCDILKIEKENVSVPLEKLMSVGLVLGLMIGAGSAKIVEIDIEPFVDVLVFDIVFRTYLLAGEAFL